MSAPTCSHGVDLEAVCVECGRGVSQQSVEVPVGLAQQAEFDRMSREVARPFPKAAPTADARKRHAEERVTSSTGGVKAVKLEQYNQIPARSMRELAEHYGKGAAKYEAHNFRRGYDLSLGFNAIMRHLWAWEAGYDYDVCSNDPDGCSHFDADGEPFEPREPDTCFNHLGSHHLIAAIWHGFGMHAIGRDHPDFDDRFDRAR